MVKMIWLMFGATLLMFGAQQSTMPVQLSLPGVTPLKLNGEGVREKFFLDLYRIGLYLPQRSKEPQKIVRADASEAVRIVIISSLIGEKLMREGIEKGFKRATHSKIAPLKERIERFVSSFKSGVHKHDVFTFYYYPKEGTLIYKNGIRINRIEGKAFKEALWKIWLGEDPVQRDLKSALLGG